MALKDLMPWKHSKSDLPARREATVVDPFVTLQQQMNDLFDGFFRDFGVDWSRPFGGLERFGQMAGMPGTWNPTTQMSETEGEYVLRAELPGLEDKDLDVRLEGDVLTLRGARRDEKTEEGRTERSSRSFHQSFTLPPGVDRDHIAGELKNGVLTLTLPKTEDAKKNVRRIEIQSSS